MLTVYRPNNYALCNLLLILTYYWNSFHKKVNLIKFTHGWQFRMFLDNIFHQNDGTWSPLLFRQSPEVSVVRRGSYSYTWMPYKNKIKIKKKKQNKTSGSDGVHPTQWTETRGHTILVIYMILFWPRLLPVIFGTEEVIKYHHSDEVCCPRTYYNYTKLSIASKSYLVFDKNLE